MQYESILVFESWTPKQKLLRMKSSGVFKFHSFKLDSFLGAIRLLRDGFLHLGYGLTGDCSPKVPKMGRMTQIPPWPWLLWLFQTPALDAANGRKLRNPSWVVSVQRWPDFLWKISGVLIVLNMLVMSFEAGLSRESLSHWKVHSDNSLSQTSHVEASKLQTLDRCNIKAWTLVRG